jgi:hypothetical protein
MDLGALAWVERNNKIMIEGGDLVFSPSAADD